MISAIEKIGGFTFAEIVPLLLLWTVIAVILHYIVDNKYKLSAYLKYRIYFAQLTALPLGIIMVIWFDVDLLNFFNFPAEHAGYVSTEMNPDSGLAFSGNMSQQLLHDNDAQLLFSSKFLFSIGISSLLMAMLTIYGLVKFSFELVRLRLYRGDIHLLFPELSKAILKSTLGNMELAVQRHSSIRLGVREGVDVPVVFGYIRPIILLPPELLMNKTKMEMAVAHELIHVGRHDYLINWITRLITSLFFYLPLVKRFEREIILYRELTCDEEYLARTDKPIHSYASLLFEFATSGRVNSSLVLPITNRQQTLIKRINHMKNPKNTINKMERKRRFAFSISLVVLLISVGLLACSDLGLQVNSDEDLSQSTVIFDTQYESDMDFFDFPTAVFFYKGDKGKVLEGSTLFRNEQIGEILNKNFRRLAIDINSSVGQAVMSKYGINSTSPALMVTKKDRDKNFQFFGVSGQIDPSSKSEYIQEKLAMITNML